VALLYLLFLLCKETTNFTISYEPQDTKIAKEVLEFAEEEFPRILKDMGVAQGVIPRIEIKLVSSISEIQKINGFPDWGIGCAIPSKYTILLKSPRIVKYPVDLRTLVAHEISHIVLGNLSQVKIPRWFDEGIAMYESYEWRIGESMWLSWANFTHSILPLSSIALNFPEESQKAKLAYVESFSTIAFIINQFGEESLKEIIGALKEANSFDEALRRVLGLNRTDFADEWKEWVEHKYTGFNVFFNMFFPGGLLLFIFFLAIFLKRKRIKYETTKDMEV
jgi:hypothetical protein